KAKQFRELFLPAMVTSDTTYWIDFMKLPFSPDPVYFDLKPFDKPRVSITAKLLSGEEVSLGTMGGFCNEHELVQHPLVSQPVIEYRKTLQYFVEKTKDDFFAITRKEASPFLDDFDFRPIAYQQVPVVLDEPVVDLGGLPEDLTAWEVFFDLPRYNDRQYRPAPTPAWAHKAGHYAQPTNQVYSSFSWSIYGMEPVDKITLPDLPTGAAALFFPNRDVTTPNAVGTAFTTQINFESVTFEHWMIGTWLY
ncbi:MAG: hypothetical protein AAF597_09940, partial [Bacteroidota bacterium]